MCGSSEPKRPFHFGSSRSFQSVGAPVLTALVFQPICDIYIRIRV